MTARIVELADGIVASLAQASVAGEPFCLEFVPVRSYADDALRLEEDDQLHVDVVVGGHDEAGLLARGTVGYLGRVTIGVRYKFKPESQEDDGRIALSEVDKYVALVEQIYEFLARQKICDARWFDSEIRFSIVHEHLRNWRQFTGLISVRFRITASLPQEVAR